MIRFLQKPGPIKKYVLGGILGIVSLTMVTYLIPGGISDYFSGGLSIQGVLAKVGDQDVTTPEVAQRARIMAKQQFKGEVPDALMPYLMQRTAQDIISRKAVIYEADRMGLGASDDELRSFLHQGEYGQEIFPNGAFIGQQAYEQLISQNNMSVQQFEQNVKGDIAARKLLSAVAAAVAVSDKDIREELQRQDTKVKFEYAVVSLDDIKKQIKPTDAELKAFYEQNKQQYVNSIPQKIKAKYILIDPGKLEQQVAITPTEIQQYYKQHQDEYRIPETVTVRHILIKTPTPDANGKLDQKGVDAARAKAEDIAKQLKAGGNFADLAKKYSEDPGSAKDGGLLQPLSRGHTGNPEFEQAAFNTPGGQTTGVIRSVAGFHIIHVESKQDARLKPLDEVRAAIEPILKKQKAATQAQSVANAVQTLARTAGLDKAASEKNLSVTTTDFIAETDPLPGLGSAPDFTNALFGAKKNDPPTLMATPQGYAVYQVIDIQPPQTPTFDQIRAQLEEQFRSQRAQGLLGQKTQELADRARSENDLAKAAKQAGATVKTSDLVDRNSQVPELGALTGAASIAFTLKNGEISGPIQAGPNGAVLRIVEIQAPTDALMKQDWDKAKQALVEQKREEFVELYIDNLRSALEKEGKIKINKKEMERITNLAGS